jgi:hypothetical protein
VLTVRGSFYNELQHRNRVLSAASEHPYPGLYARWAARSTPSHQGGIASCRLDDSTARAVKTTGLADDVDLAARIVVEGFTLPDLVSGPYLGR